MIGMEEYLWQWISMLFQLDLVVTPATLHLSHQWKKIFICKMSAELQTNAVDA